MQVIRCPSCDGYGWFEDELEAEFDDEFGAVSGGAAQDCDWCGGVGYIYRDAQGVDRPIPQADWGRVADALETLEDERMREIGYTGEAKKPWQQDIRGGALPAPPIADDDGDNGDDT